MKVIFGTTNKRKIDDLKNLIDYLKLRVEVLSLNDINYKDEIEENGKTIEENSLIKAREIFKFSKENNLNYPIITDDSGLFVDCLNGKPGIYTARYAEEELKENPSLPNYQCVIKLLNELKNEINRNAKYRSVVTCMFQDGSYFQEYGESSGVISKEIIGSLERPYFYTVFILNEYNKVFNELKSDELLDTYRYQALKKVLKKINK